MQFKKLLLTACCLCVASGVSASEKPVEKKGQKYAIVFDRLPFFIHLKGIQLSKVLNDMLATGEAKFGLNSMALRYCSIAFCNHPC